MIRWITRLAMAIATLIVLARAAAAHEPPAVYPDAQHQTATGCDPDRPFHPDDPLACPPGWGEVHLPASFFIGAGGVGPDVGYAGRGGGGGYLHASASGSARSFAFARASASARVSVGGRPGRHPPRSGCGCR